MTTPSNPSPFRSVPPTPPAPRRPADLRTAQEHHKAGRLGEAESAYRRWLGLHAGDAATLHGLGLVNHQAGRQHEAVALLRQAVRAAGNPAVAPAKAAEYRSNLAAVLGRLGRHADAVAELAEVVRVRPDYAEGHCNLGVALEHCGRKEEAAAAYRRAIAVRPQYAMAFNCLGNCLRKMQLADQAEWAYRAAVRLKPDHAGAYNNLAMVLSGQGRLAEVIECRRKVAELKPGSAAAGSALLSTLHYATESRPGMLLEMAREWGRKFAGGGGVGSGGVGSGEGSTKHETRNPKEIQNSKTEIQNERDTRLNEPRPSGPSGSGVALPDRSLTLAARSDRDPQRKLRVGFVSSNLSGHPEGRFLRPVLANLDREAFETTCYSAGPRADAVTALLRQLCDRWRDIRRMSDEQVAAGIRQDRIDILVDLTGHFGGNRLGVFARRPARVQMIHFGYPGTSGMAAMGWRVTDEYAEPGPSAREKHEIRNTKSETNSKFEEEMTETGGGSACAVEPGRVGSADRRGGSNVASDANSAAGALTGGAIGKTAGEGTGGTGVRPQWDFGHDDFGCALARVAGAVPSEPCAEAHPAPSVNAETKTPTLPSPGVPGEGKEGGDASPANSAARSAPYTSEKLLRLPGLAWVYDEPLEARAAGALPAGRNGRVTFLCANNPLKVTPEAVAAWAKILAAVPDSRLTMLLDEKGPQSARREKPNEPRPSGSGDSTQDHSLALAARSDRPARSGDSTQDHSLTLAARPDRPSGSGDPTQDHSPALAARPDRPAGSGESGQDHSLTLAARSDRPPGNGDSTQDYSLTLAARPDRPSGSGDVAPDHSLTLAARSNGELTPDRLPPARPPDEAAGRWLREAFSRYGIDPARIGFAGRQSRGAYFGWIASADIALDPFPYNGGVTTCDTLWMGVPVISLIGDSYWSRQGLALLSNVGHADLAAPTIEQYVQTAIALATDLARLAGIRRGLRERMRRSALVDVAGFARKMEAGYQQMWRESHAAAGHL